MTSTQNYKFCLRKSLHRRYLRFQIFLCCSRFECAHKAVKWSICKMNSHTFDFPEGSKYTLELFELRYYFRFDQTESIFIFKLNQLITAKSHWYCQKFMKKILPCCLFTEILSEYYRLYCLFQS